MSLLISRSLTSEFSQTAATFQEIGRKISHYCPKFSFKQWPYRPSLRYRKCPIVAPHHGVYQMDKIQSYESPTLDTEQEKASSDF
jgi:hypothetical protein